MKLYRSRNDKYHRADCRYANLDMHWVWADGKTRDQIEAGAAPNGVLACKTCDPLAAIPIRCERCTLRPAYGEHAPCCSSHGKHLCCRCYRTTHFVEVGICCWRWNAEVAS